MQSRKVFAQKLRNLSFEARKFKTCFSKIHTFSESNDISNDQNAKFCDHTNPCPEGECCYFPGECFICGKEVLQDEP